MHNAPQIPTRWGHVVARLRPLATALLIVAGVAYGADQTEALPTVPEDHFRLVSWNLRNFPVRPGDAARDPPHNIERMRRALARLDADVAAFQEVHDPAALGALLGDSYQWIASDGGGTHDQHLVIAWRTAEVEPIEAPVEHTALSLGGRLRPALSLRLAAVHGTNADFTVAAVHLKARPSGLALRRVQWEQLLLMTTELLEHESDLVLLGDFNVTGGTRDPENEFISGALERRQLEQALGRVGLWPAEVGACTAYWQGVRHDRWLEASRLDLAFLAGFDATRVETAIGAHCRRHRCAPFQSSAAHPEPSLESLSDHCPVLIDLPWPRRD